MHNVIMSDQCTRKLRSRSLTVFTFSVDGYEDSVVVASLLHQLSGQGKKSIPKCTGGMDAVEAE